MIFNLSQNSPPLARSSVSSSGVWRSNADINLGSTCTVVGTVCINGLNKLFKYVWLDIWGSQQCAVFSVNFVGSFKNHSSFNRESSNFPSGLLLADMMTDLADDESHESRESCSVALVEAASRDCSEVTLSCLLDGQGQLLHSLQNSRWKSQLLNYVTKDHPEHCWIHVSWPTKKKIIFKNPHNKGYTSIILQNDFNPLRTSDVWSGVLWKKANSQSPQQPTVCDWEGDIT